MLYNIIAGLGIGLLGSFHCIGMCGPIALSLPIYNKTFLNKLTIIIWYNMGRAISYAALGMLFGLLGNQFVVSGYQRTLSILSGTGILFILLFGKYFAPKAGQADKVYHSLQKKLADVLRAPEKNTAFLLAGILNGLLPCGLVYIGIGSAIATGDVLSAAALMFMFGLGTFPLMISLMIFGRSIPISVRNKIRRSMPVLITLMAILIILRGLNLGIPYISPQPQNNLPQVQQVKCHKA